MNKKWRNRLLLSYLPLFFIASVSLLFLAYLMIGELSKQAARKANLVLTQQTLAHIDRSLADIEARMLEEVLGNKALQSFVSPDQTGNEKYADYMAAGALAEIERSNPLLHSVYLFRTADRMVLTSTSLSAMERFADSKYIGRSISSLEPFSWSGHRLYREAGGREAQVVSLVKFTRLYDRSIIVVNVDMDKLSGVIREAMGSTLYYLQIFDRNGALLASNSMQARPEAEIDHAWSSVRSDYTGWTIRSGVYGSGIAEWVSSLFYVWLLLGALVVIGGVIWLVYVSRRNYKPVELIVDQIAAYSKQHMLNVALNEERDELRFIGRAVDNLLDQASLLLEQNRENRLYRRRDWFLRLAEGALAADERTLAAEMEQLGLTQGWTELIVALVELDRFADFASTYARRDQLLLRYVIQTVVQELSAGRTFETWTEWTSGSRMCVLLFDREPNAAASAAALLDKLIAWVGQNMAVTITAGLGSAHTELRLIARSHRNAAEALKYKAALGTSRIVTLTDLRALPQADWNELLRTVHDIGQSFRSGSDEWIALFDGLWPALEEKLLSRKQLQDLLNYLTYFVQKEVMDLSEEFRDIWRQSVADRLNAAVEREETAERLLAAFRSVLSDAFAQMDEVRQSRGNRKLIEELKAYIDRQADNPALSLTALSDEFGMNYSYLSALFKEAFGMTFSDYVVSIRMDKAQRMLRETKETVQQIALAVGYTNTLTFIRAFKKATGCTPGNYRKDTAAH